MDYRGDYLPGVTFAVLFNTTKTDMTPITIAGSPTIVLYKDGIAGASTGLTLSVDYGGVTGLHKIVVNMANTSIYEEGHDYEVVFTAGTVDSISITGKAQFCFSISNRDRRLASDGLDDIDTTELTTIPANFKEMILALYNKEYGYVNMTTEEEKVYDSSGNVISTQLLSDDGTTQTREAAT